MNLEEQPISLNLEGTPHEGAGPDQLLKYGTLLGVALILAAMIWVGLLRGRALGEAWFSGDLGEAVGETALGLLLGTLSALIAWMVGQRLQAFVDIRDRLLAALNMRHFTLLHNALLALLAALPEEIFFRGALQPVLGVWITALVFGVLHALTRTYFIYATAAGLALGALFAWTDALWAPIMAHFAVDFLTLTLLARWARQHHASIPSLVDDQA
ncbi:MAG: CPBP family intramembrane metalloprotease [Chloroflexi bacterium]|nr:CPBP family intramembrane metalloprotease [Chloroflexota bacterium]